MASIPLSCSLPQNCRSVGENGIALQLPELKMLLGVLREKRERGNEFGDCVGEKVGPGNAYLVGTGPGDPKLLTLNAVRAIKSADLLLCDRLVSDVFVSSISYDWPISKTKEEIDELLLSSAEAGANAVRLKGGDAPVFGRGGEEMEFLQQQGIQVQVIPGVTVASGIAAELGIP